MSIREEYSEVVSSLAERAKLISEENDESFEVEEGVRQAIADGLFYSEDEAVIIANAYDNGFFKWGGEIDWQAIDENLFEDILNEVKEIL